MPGQANVQNSMLSALEAGAYIDSHPFLVFLAAQIV
jgi:hypothetical protein